MISSPSGRSSSIGWHILRERSLLVFDFLFVISVNAGALFLAMCRLAELKIAEFWLAEAA